MGNPRRHYRHNDLCLVTNRLAEGLPFVPNAYMNAILYGALARASARNPGIVICAFTFIQNHYHLIVHIHTDAEEMANFLHDLNDELAKIVKKLLGKRNAKIWGQRTHVAIIGNFGAAIKEFGYCFLNAVKANLAERAKDWIGVNSYRFLFSQEPEDYKWVRTAKLQRLPNKEFTKRDLRRLHNRWINQPAPSYTLYVNPYSWKNLFDDSRKLSNDQIRDLILTQVAAGETQCAKERTQNNLGTANPEALSLQNPHKYYVPKKFGRRVHCICTEPEIRQELIEEYKAFCETCAAVWRAWKKGDFTAKYPPGAFLPPRPPLASALLEFQ